MHCRDRGLQLISPYRVQTQRIFDEANAFADLVLIPARALLLLKGHKFPHGIDACATAGIMQQHQRQQSEILGLFWQKLAKCATQPNGFCAKVGAYQVLARSCYAAFIEYEIDYGLHWLEAFTQ